MRAFALARQQGGMPVLAVLFLSLLAAGLMFRYRSLHPDDRLAHNFALAKAALIARATADLSRPGSLPCPDLLTDDNGLANHPGDGKADMLVRNDCPSHVGWLPYVTLDLPVLSDHSGTPLWYAMAGAHRDDDNAPPLNSDSVATLWLDDNDDVAALLIAPGPARSGQRRPSSQPGDYLDEANGNGDDGHYSRNSGNDVVQPVRRSELFAAVEKRVAGEVLRCLREHAALAAGQQAYPWPSPPGRNDGQALAGSRFGRLPLTQPSAGSSTELSRQASRMDALRQALERSGIGTELAPTLAALSDPLASQYGLFTVLYMAASRVWQSASALQGKASALSTELEKDLKPNSNGTVSIINSEQTRIRNATETLVPELGSLEQSLSDTGLDVFPAELRERLNQLEQSPDSSRLAALHALVANSDSSHDTLNAALRDLLATVEYAMTARRDADAWPNDPALGKEAARAANVVLADAGSLLSSLPGLHNDLPAEAIASLASALRAAGTNQTTEDSYTQELADIRRQVLAANAGSPAVGQARESLLSCLDRALAGTGGNDCATELDNMAAVSARNDSNITRSSLKAATTALRKAGTDFAALTGSDTRARVPYALTLQESNARFAFWNGLLIARSASFAGELKNTPYPAGETPEKSNPQPGSILSLVGDAETVRARADAALAEYLAAPTSKRQDDAEQAVAQLRGDLAALAGKLNADHLAAQAGNAAALPMYWRAASCRPLQVGGSSWWTRNQWHELIFYQISDAFSGNTPRLLVDNHRGLPVVVVAAGRKYAGQTRPSAWIRDYLEGDNAHPSRDGEAYAPSVLFLNARNGNGNDRLAY